MDCIERDDLFTAGDRPLPVDFYDSPELKKRIWVQGLTGLEKSRWEQSLMRRNGSKPDPRKVAQARGSLLALCIVNNDKDRKKLYTIEDAGRLSNLSAAIIEPIYDLCRKLSGIGEKDIEDLEQLSAEGDGNGSPLN